MVQKKPEVEEIEEARQKRHTRLLALGEAIDAALAHRSGRPLAKLEEAVEEGRKLAKAPPLPTAERPDLTEWDLRLVAVGREAQAMGIPAADIVHLNVQAERKLRAKVDEDSPTPRPIPDPTTRRVEERDRVVWVTPASIAAGLCDAIEDAGALVIESYRFRVKISTVLQSLPDREARKVWKKLFDAIRPDPDAIRRMRAGFAVFNEVRALDPERKQIGATIRTVARRRGEPEAAVRKLWNEALRHFFGRQRIPAPRPSRRHPAI